MIFGSTRDCKLALARERRRARRLERYEKEGSSNALLLTPNREMANMTMAGETEAGSAGLRRAVGAHAAQALALRVGPAGGSATRQG